MGDRRDTNGVDDALARFAGLRHGVFELGEVAPLGLTKQMAWKRVTAGRLWRLYLGVYSIVPPQLLRLEGHWLAAVLACGPGAVLSHMHAAALWDLRRASSGATHITVPSTAGRARREGITIHRTSTLLPSQTTLRRHIPVTQPARTLSDLRNLLPAGDWERTRSRALDRHLDLGPLGDGAVPSFSYIEKRLKSICRRHSLPSPLPQQIIGPYTVDFLWPDARLIVEVDDFRTHGRRETFESDRERDAWLQLRGYRVVRFTWRQLEHQPAGVVRALRGLLGFA